MGKRTEPAESDMPVLYFEPGARWRILWLGPLLALAGYLAERVLGGPLHVVTWALVGLGLLVANAVWVYARRRFLAVRLTTTQLTHGREHLDVARIATVTEVGTPAGARVLGGGLTVPHKYDGLPVKLTDGTVVLAWAKDVSGLRDALTRLLAAPGAHDAELDT